MDKKYLFGFAVLLVGPMDAASQGKSFDEQLKEKKKELHSLRVQLNSLVDKRESKSRELKGEFEPLKQELLGRKLSPKEYRTISRKIEKLENEHLALYSSSGKIQNEMDSLLRRIRLLSRETGEDKVTLDPSAAAAKIMAEYGE